MDTSIQNYSKCQTTYSVSVNSFLGNARMEKYCQQIRNSNLYMPQLYRLSLLSLAEQGLDRFNNRLSSDYCPSGRMTLIRKMMKRKWMLLQK